MKKSIFQMKSMLISHINQKNLCSVTICIFQIRALVTGHIYTITYPYYNMTQKCNKLKNIAIIRIKKRFVFCL